VSAQDPAGWQRLLLPQSTADRRAARTLREDVRAAKESPSAHPQTEVPLPEPFGDVLVTRTELEGLVRPGLPRSVESAGPPLGKLAGIYLVATLIAERLGGSPHDRDRPATAARHHPFR
jgi:hypothetical protein